jgi:hypothetical protein
MHRIKIRIALSLGILALVAAAAGSAQARPAGNSHKSPKTRTSKAAVRSVRADHGKGITNISTSPGAVYVEAGSTGDGPADDDECDRWAGAINDARAELREDDATSSGDVNEDIENVNNLTDGAMDRGCFIVY